VAMLDKGMNHTPGQRSGMAQDLIMILQTAQNLKLVMFISELFHLIFFKHG
jgi:hypothetical protein